MSNARIQGTLYDGTVVELLADPGTNALYTIDVVHARIHNGHTFNFSAILTIPATTTIYLLGKCNANNIHFRNFSITADEGPVDIALFEAPTITDNGSQQTPVNRNRTSSNTPTLEVYTGATVSDDGTQLFTFRNFADSTFLVTSISTEIIPEEWILAANTDYIIKLENTSASAANISAAFLWYEEI